MEDPESPGRYSFPRPRKIAPKMNMSLSRFGPFLHNQGCGEFRLALFQIRNSSEAFAQADILSLEEVRQDLALLVVSLVCAKTHNREDLARKAGFALLSQVFEPPRLILLKF